MENPSHWTLVCTEAVQAHLAGANSQQGAWPTVGLSKVQLTKIPRPSISGGCSQEYFQGFKGAWKRYTRAYNETDEAKLKDQLVHCPDADLSSALDKVLGDRINILDLGQLLHEIEVWSGRATMSTPWPWWTLSKSVMSQCDSSQPASVGFHQSMISALSVNAERKCQR